MRAGHMGVKSFRLIWIYYRYFQLFS